MRVVHRIHFWFLFAMFSILALAATTRAQEPRYPKPTELPNPYRLVEGWPTLPKSMNGGGGGKLFVCTSALKEQMFLSEEYS